MPKPTEAPIIAAVINRADLEEIVGVVRLPELIFRSSAEAATPALVADRIATICQAATDKAAGILFKAFSSSQIAALFATDWSIWHDVQMIGAGLCGLYQTELVDPENGGVFPFCTQYREAIRDLHDRTKGQPRSVAEARVGNNPTVLTTARRIPCASAFTDRNGRTPF